MDNAIKWTDTGIFWSSAVQTFVIVVTVVVAYIQYRGSVNSGRISLTVEKFREIQKRELRDAIGRISAHLDYHKDWADLQTVLMKPDGDEERERCEEDLFLIANFYSELNLLYNKQLIDRALFLDQYGEYTLFVASSAIKAAELYKQPDYKGLFTLARACQAYYKANGGRYSSLRDFVIPRIGADENVTSSSPEPRQSPAHDLSSGLTTAGSTGPEPHAN